MRERACVWPVLVFLCFSLCVCVCGEHVWYVHFVLCIFSFSFFPSPIPPPAHPPFSQRSLFFFCFCFFALLVVRRWRESGVGVDAMCACACACVLPYGGVFEGGKGREEKRREKRRKRKRKRKRENELGAAGHQGVRCVGKRCGRRVGGKKEGGVCIVEYITWRLWR